MIFSKDNLRGRIYNWNVDSDVNMLTDQFPTHSRFDRLSGDCVLRMINLFNFLVSKITLAQGLLIEESLTKELPLKLSSELTVFNWLREKHLHNRDLKIK